MDRTIVGFRQDDEGDWVALLDCGHRQHVRHRPPFQQRPWVLEEPERAAHLGTSLACPLCERGEMPDSARFAWRSATWDARSLPRGLRRAHKLGSGTWGRLVVEQGCLTYRARAGSPVERVLVAGTDQSIPPGVEHEVDPSDDVQLYIEFFDLAPEESPGGEEPPSAASAAVGAIAAGAAGAEATAPELQDGGDPACWAHLFCQECGSELSEGHLAHCSMT